MIWKWEVPEFVIHLMLQVWTSETALEGALRSPWSLLFSMLNTPSSHSVSRAETLQHLEHLHGLLWTSSSSTEHFTHQICLPPNQRELQLKRFPCSHLHSTTSKNKTLTQIWFSHLLLWVALLLREGWKRLMTYSSPAAILTEPLSFMAQILTTVQI